MRIDNEPSNNQIRGNGIVKALRSLVPQVRHTPLEALQLAEAQARLFLKLTGAVDPPVPNDPVLSLKSLIVVTQGGMPSSGSTHWTGEHWHVSLNADEHPLRQRFSLFHEFKHVVDHEHQHLLYPGKWQSTTYYVRERLADYFAGCILMPKPWLTSFFCSGHTSLRELSSIFMVSERALEVRLAQLGLREPKPRSQRVPVRRPPQPSHSPTTYFRLAGLTLDGAAV